MIKKYCAFIVFFFCSIFILFSLGCETTPVRQTPLPGEPVAHMPKMVVGDTWVVTDYNRKFQKVDRYTGKVIGVSPDGSFVLEATGQKEKIARLMYYDNEFTQLGVKNKQSGKEEGGKRGKRLNFPLFVGKKWSSEFYGKSKRGSVYRYREDYQVKKYEMVNTKAGSIMAFKISLRQYNLGTGWMGTGDYWYSPEAKIIIKSNYSWLDGIGRDLIAYELATVDATPPVIEITTPKIERGIAVVKATKQTEIQGSVTDDSAVKWFEINDNKITLNEAGQFFYLASLSEGTNRFELSASDTQGNEAKKVVEITYAVPKPAPIYKKKAVTSLARPTCWVLSIGISNYMNERLSLRYAHNDARTIAQVLKDQEGKLFSEVFVKTLINEQCTRANILESLSSHLGRAGPDDVVFIFMAGHGVRHKQTGSYYFLTYNADSESLVYEGMRWSDFEEAINILSNNVNKIVLALDTCHAGSMKVYLRGAEGGEDLALVLKEASGLYILASSKAGEDSIEKEQFKFPLEKEGHGAFTYALLKGLSGEANFDGDSYVSVHELFKYVANLVPRMTEGRQHPYSRTAGTDMPIAAVNKY